MKTLKQKHEILSNIIGEAEVKRLLHNWYDRAIRRERKRKAVTGNNTKDIEFCRAVLADLKERTGYNYRLGDDIKASILARKKDGNSLEDFRHVHEIKTLEWKDDPTMRGYLHPSTLYRPSRFDKYKMQYNFWQQDLEAKKRKEEQKKRARKLEQLNEQKPSPEEAERIHKIIEETQRKLAAKTKRIRK